MSIKFLLAIFIEGSGLQIRVRTGKLFFLLLNKNICCGYSKEPSQWDDSFKHPKHMFKLMGNEINAILGAKTILIWIHGSSKRRSFLPILVKIWPCGIGGVGLKTNCWRHMMNIIWPAPDNEWSQELTLSTSYSGELKHECCANLTSSCEFSLTLYGPRREKTCLWSLHIHVVWSAPSLSAY